MEGNIVGRKELYKWEMKFEHNKKVELVFNKCYTENNTFCYEVKLPSGFIHSTDLDELLTETLNHIMRTMVDLWEEKERLKDKIRKINKDYQGQED